MGAPTLKELPLELVLQIMSYLTTYDVVSVLGTCKELRAICRDDGFWKNHCFVDSRLASMIRRKNWRQNKARPQSFKARRIEIRAAWNAVFENEPAAWYDEYIQRHAPIATNWFELPRRGDGRLLDNADVLDVCGVALYRPDGVDVGVGDDGTAGRRDGSADGRKGDTLQGIPTLLAVAPLEDGSVCLWDVNGTVKRRGAIVQQSTPGLLFIGIQGAGKEKSLQQLGFSATECVSVDSPQHLAYFAIQNRLVEVDLQTLSVVGIEVFPQTITALSAAHPSVPLSVGTGAGICLHDSRARAASSGAFKSVDEIVSSSKNWSHCAPFPQPGPLSIIHAQQPGSEEDISNDIFAAGRISSIFHYDRRKISIVKDSIHSGASLCGLSSMPYAFPSIADYGRLNKSRAERPGANFAGRTVVACGEYKSKGSLELYPIDDGQLNKPMVNRQTSSSAKIFSVASHGKRLVVSDGAGFIKWFERDGFTEVRRCNLGGDDYVEDAETEAERAPNVAAWTESGDIARKLLPTQLGSHVGGCGGKLENSFTNNDLLFWTGEKLGLISFSPKLGFRSLDFVEDMKTEEERAAEKEGNAYRTKMRQLFKSARYFGEDSDSDD